MPSRKKTKEFSLSSFNQHGCDPNVPTHERAHYKTLKAILDHNHIQYNHRDLTRAALCKRISEYIKQQKEEYKNQIITTTNPHPASIQIPVFKSVFVTMLAQALEDERKENERLRTEINVPSADLKESDKTIKSLTNLINELKTTISSLQSSNQSLQAENTTLRDNMRDLSAVKQRLEQSLTNLVTQHQQSEQEIKQLQERITVSKQHETSLDNSMIHLNQEITGQLKHLQDVQAELVSSKNDNSILTSLLNTFRTAPPAPTFEVELKELGELRNSRQTVINEKLQLENEISNLRQQMIDHINQRNDQSELLNELKQMLVKNDEISYKVGDVNHVFIRKSLYNQLFLLQETKQQEFNRIEQQLTLQQVELRTEIVDKQTIVDQIRQENVALNQVLEKLQSKTNADAELIVELKSDIRSQEQEMERIITIVQDLHRELQMSKTQFKQLQTRYDELKQSHDALQAQLSSSQIDFKGRLTETKDQITDNEVKIQNLIYDIKTARGDNTILTQELHDTGVKHAKNVDELTAHYVNLLEMNNAKMIMLEQAKNHLEQLLKERDERLQNLLLSPKNNHSRELEMKKIQELLHQSQAEANILVDNRTRELRDQIQQQTHENQQLKQELIDFQTKYKNVIIEDESKESIEDEIKQMDSQILTTETHLDELHQNIAQLKESINQLKTTEFAIKANQKSFAYQQAQRQKQQEALRVLGITRAPTNLKEFNVLKKKLTFNNHPDRAKSPDQAKLFTDNMHVIDQQLDVIKESLSDVQLNKIIDSLELSTTEYVMFEKEYQVEFHNLKTLREQRTVLITRGRSKNPSLGQLRRQVSQQAELITKLNGDITQLTNYGKELEQKLVDCQRDMQQKQQLIAQLEENERQARAHRLDLETRLQQAAERQNHGEINRLNQEQIILHKQIEELMQQNTLQRQQLVELNTQNESLNYQYQQLQLQQLNQHNPVFKSATNKKRPIEESKEEDEDGLSKKRLRYDQENKEEEKMQGVEHQYDSQSQFQQQQPRPQFSAVDEIFNLITPLDRRSPSIEKNILVQKIPLNATDPPVFEPSFISILFIPLRNGSRVTDNARLVYKLLFPSFSERKICGSYEETAFSANPVVNLDNFTAQDYQAVLKDITQIPTNESFIPIAAQPLAEPVDDQTVQTRINLHQQFIYNIYHSDSAVVCVDTNNPNLVYGYMLGCVPNSKEQVGEGIFYHNPIYEYSTNTVTRLGKIVDVKQLYYLTQVCASSNYKHLPGQMIRTLVQHVPDTQLIYLETIRPAAMIDDTVILDRYAKFIANAYGRIGFKYLRYSNDSKVETNKRHKSTERLFAKLKNMGMEQESRFIVKENVNQQDKRLITVDIFILERAGIKGPNITYRVK